MRSIKAIFYKALGAWVLGSLYGMPSWRDRIEERRRRFQQLMLQAEHGDSAASRELENEIWQNFVNDHGTPEQQAAYATRADAREFYAYTETLHDYYATYHNKRASDIKRLEALKEIFVIVTKIFSRANQRRFRQQFGESPADIRRSMVVFFQAACEVRRKAAPGSIAARRELVTLYNLACSQAYAAFNLPIDSPEGYNAWLVSAVAPRKLEPREFVGDYLPRFTRTTVGHYTNRALRQRDRTLAVWVYCYLQFLGWSVPPELQAYVAQAQ